MMPFVVSVKYLFLLIHSLSFVSTEHILAEENWGCAIRWRQCLGENNSEQYPLTLTHTMDSEKC